MDDLTIRLAQVESDTLGETLAGMKSKELVALAVCYQILNCGKLFSAQ